MSTSQKQAVLALCLIAGLFGPLLYLRGKRRADANLARQQAMDRYGMSLEEVAEASGIHMVHSIPVLDPKLENIAPMIASMGASVSIVDYDNDGWNDIYVTNGSPGSRTTFTAT